MKTFSIDFSTRFHFFIVFSTCFHYLPIYNVSPVHVFQSQYDFGRVEPHLIFIEHPMLGEMIVKVAPVHEVEDEAKFVGRVKCVRHAHDEGAVDLWGSRIIIILSIVYLTCLF